MTKVVFEVAALASALNQAAKVAPTKGEAFEKAAGVLFDITSEECIIMATDNLVRYSTWLTPEGFVGDKNQLVWRLPAQVIASVVGKLKPGRHRTLILEQEGRTVKMTHGTTRATFVLMDDTRYPRWTPFSPDNMTEVTGLAKAIGHVAACAAKQGEPPLIGVHINGELVIATDKYRFACAPLDVKLEEPITIPPHSVTSILKNNGTVMMRVEGSQIYLMPDEYTQIAMTAYGVPYPAVEKVLKREWPVMAKVSKQGILDTIDLVMTMTGSDRMPIVTFMFGKQQVAVMVINDEIGRIGHVFDTPGQFDFANRHEMRFSPENLLMCLNGCVGDEITLGFDTGSPFAALYLRGNDGVEFWVAPRQKTEPDAE